jgi:hypothetical protein
MDNEFVAQGLCFKMNLFVALGLEYHLSPALSIPQVDENDSAMIPAPVDPASERYLFPNI